MTPSSSRVAIRYLKRTPTDNVSDITFSVHVGEMFREIVAVSPRLGPVGHLVLEYVDLGDGSSWEEDQAARESDREFGTTGLAARADLASFRKQLKIPDLQVLGVRSSWIDQRFRGEAVGERLYLIGIALAAKHHRVVAPNHVYGGPRATSADARRVWKKLLPRLPHKGDLVWGGGLNLHQLVTSPLKPRRGHGFGGVREVPEYRDED